VYDRSYEGRELNFEASGALMSASLIMRDRETDSWWSIMTSTAIGGALDGAELVEMPVSVKAQWADWVAEHPDTLVLSVDGETHIETNTYENYFASDSTFRDLEIDDDRLPPKEPIFGGWVDGLPHAVAHSTFAGGAIIPLEDGRQLLLYRPVGVEIFASSRVYLLADPVARADVPAILEAIDAGSLEAKPVSGFDTFWYSWVSVNERSPILR